jgi:ABC-type transport system involved in cytochrome bd biosynthesis fused ATPase/permease subunit
MRTLRLYLPEIVLFTWAVVVWAVGSTDLVVVAGLCLTAISVAVCTPELARRYQKKACNGRQRQRHP